MTIQVQQKNIYGSIKFYPVNELAAQFARLMKQKTFDEANLREIKAMGVAIEVQSDTVTF